MKNDRRGIALMLTMMVTAFVLVLLGAFITLNQGQLNLMASTQTNDALERASQTVYEYCFSRLENNKFWGSAAFPEDRQDMAVRNTMLVEEIKGTTKIKGETNLDDATFEVVINNNITGPGTNAQGVPAHACRLDIEVRRNGLVSNHRIQLNTAPLYDASAVASEGMTIDSQRLTVASKDPQRNIIRSQTGLNAPGYNNLDFAPAPNSAEQGILWAGSDITLGGSNLRTDLSARHQAVSETGGRFVDNSRTNYDIHDLKRSEIKVSKNSRVMGNGIYVFGHSDVTYTNDSNEQVTDTIFTLERREYNLVDGQPTIGNVKELWYYGGALPNNWVGKDEWIKTDGQTDTAFAHRVDSLNFQLYEGDDLIRADLTQSKLQLSANVDVLVDGDFGILSDEKGVTPSLEFVDYVGDGEYERGALSANGEIFIQGYVTGSGKLLANGSVSLQPNLVDIESDTQSDLSIFSGKNVKIHPPDNYGAKGDLRFTGLVYAKEDVSIYHEHKIRIEGAIVAREGELKIHAGEVELVYNPDYLDSIVQELPDAQVHLERAVWIP